jgi:hypothetical protein
MLCTPKNPIVLLIIIPQKNGYFIGNIPYFQTNPYTILRWYWGGQEVNKQRLTVFAQSSRRNFDRTETVLEAAGHVFSSPIFQVVSNAIRLCSVAAGRDSVEVCNPAGAEQQNCSPCHPLWITSTQLPDTSEYACAILCLQRLQRLALSGSA